MLPDGDPYFPLRDRRFARVEDWVAGTLDPYHVPDGKFPLLHYGERLGSSDWSKLPSDVSRHPVNLKRPPKPTLRDVAGGLNPFVSQRTRDLLEEIDPENHQFHPVTIRCAATKERLQPDTDFFYWNVLTWIAPESILDLEAMGVRMELRQAARRRAMRDVVCVSVPYKHGTEYIFSANKWKHDAGGKQIFWTTPYMTETKSVSGPHLLVFSQPAYRAFESASIRGLSFKECVVSG